MIACTRHKRFQIDAETDWCERCGACRWRVARSAPWSRWRKPTAVRLAELQAATRARLEAERWHRLCRSLGK